MPGLTLGATFPDAEIETTIGKTTLYNYQAGSWLVLMSHPADYTPVCTTEVGRATKLAPEFAKRNVKLAGLSCDSVHGKPQ